MSGETVKTRFAPSPSGMLHLGNVRTALFNWLTARREGGVFLLRIEDTDAARSSEEALDALGEDLRWLGLHWDEGPCVGGDTGPYRQAERAAIYRRYYDQLERRGLAYPCFCSPAELSVARETQLAAGKPPRYLGTCAGLTDAERRAREERGLAAALRFRVPTGRIIEFMDLVRGAQRYATEDIGDFVIRRADGSAAFFFTNAVDDALMGVTHVLRGEDHLSNTPRQLLLLEGLSLRTPRYGHIPMVVGEDGSPLSKRHGSVGVRELRERGYLPIAVHNTLARLGHYYEETGFMTMAGLAATFEHGRIGHAPAHFDWSQLDHWQKEALAHADADVLWAWMGGPVRQLVPETAKSAFIQTIRCNIAMPEDALEWARIIHADPLPYSDAASTVLAQVEAGFFQRAFEVLDDRAADYPGFVAKLQERVAVRGKRLFQPLRAALTGRLDGPELAALFLLLGADRIRRRFQHALTKVQVSCADNIQ